MALNQIFASQKLLLCWEREFLNRGQVLNLEFLKRNGRLNLVQTTISK
jgi:hypothetical protein